MKTLTIEVEYSPDSLSTDEAKDQIKKSLVGSDFKVVSFADSQSDTDSSYKKMHSSLPNQPKGADPDVNSTGAGGMVSPDSSGYPNKD
ncbi:hypothetical protein V6B33_03440 [Mangrovibacillus sp. Mu-81]|uniref:hypothetical protein n=1 Tax=Mangrovibacillus sp. Mu-81 TaxID=3121478 RepID=UPI002FE4823D